MMVGKRSTRVRNMINIEEERFEIGIVQRLFLAENFWVECSSFSYI